jgi:hypothetical protein
MNYPQLPKVFNTVQKQKNAPFNVQKPFVHSVISEKEMEYSQAVEEENSLIMSGRPSQKLSILQDTDRHFDDEDSPADEGYSQAQNTQGDDNDYMSRASQPKHVQG